MEASRDGARGVIAAPQDFTEFLLTPKIVCTVYTLIKSMTFS